MAAFRQKQEDELARDNHGFEGRAVEEMWRDPEWHEYIFTGGTGSVLDFPLMIEAADTDGGLTDHAGGDPRSRRRGLGGAADQERWQRSPPLLWRYGERGACGASDKYESRYRREHQARRDLLGPEPTLLQPTSGGGAS
ncbi:hypothetical protein GCM10010521_74470 [Streptomyces rameus]|uniref:Uncharacterized protein n=1 Tax=Streptomyces rameus TaxID=68261 RepID=A0ABN3VBR8_9ACTN